jgi:hypothetical protein
MKKKLVASDVLCAADRPSSQRQTDNVFSAAGKNRGKSNGF